MTKSDHTTVDYDISVIPSLAEDERLHVGIDTGKESHCAGIVSKSLLIKYKRFDKCPSMNFLNSRMGFEKLLESIRAYAPLDRVVILKERTGHYGSALTEYLQEHNITCYTMHVYKRMLKNKTDRRDSLNLAKTLYEQIEQGKVPGDAMKQIRHETPPTETAKKLRPLVQRKTELTRDITARKNQLTAICDELFPELTEIFKDPNRATALAIREKYPCPADIARATIGELLTCCTVRWPGQAALVKLQELAARSIGIKDPTRLHGLILEQGQLIRELREMQGNLAVVESEIEKIAIDSRDGKILMSIPGIAVGSAAAIIATIGCIAKFETPAHLRAFAGWSPRATQTGSSKDAMTLAKGGNKILKQTIYMSTWNALKGETEFKVKYDRLVPIKCNWDARTKKWRGKSTVCGRIAGDLIGLIYTLLRRDYDLLSSLPPGATPPEPALYDREIHRSHLERKASTPQLPDDVAQKLIMTFTCTSCNTVVGFKDVRKHRCVPAAEKDLSTHDSSAPAPEQSSTPARE